MARLRSPLCAFLQGRSPNYIAACDCAGLAPIETSRPRYPIMKIVADENIPHLQSFFSGLGEVTALPGRHLRPEDVADADALIVRSVTRVNADLLQGSKVRFVGTCTIGTDHLDVDYLRQQGVAFASAPGCNAEGVVQYVLTALAALQVHWQDSKVGVIGCGNVGGRLSRRLTAMGVDCRAYDPFVQRREGVPLAGLDQVLGCDIVCMHTPYTLDGPFPTHHLLNAHRLRQLKPGALLLNAGRGGAIDNRALLSYLNSGADLKVVLDVWEGEPAINTELLRKVVIGTPHIAGYSYEGKVKGAMMIHEALQRFLGTDAEAAALSAESIARPLLGELQPLACADVDSAVLASYDIFADHNRMQDALHGAEPEQVGAAFDHLRKTYPERREFSHYCAQTEQLETAQLLAELGFAVHD